MPFSASDRHDITHLWEKMAPNVEFLGEEAMERLFKSHPKTKTYFSHLNVEHGSAAVRAQGAKVLNAIGHASKNLDHLDEALSNLSDKHAHDLRVDPGNFHLLCHNILVVLAIHFPEDFTPRAHAAFDKFLAAVSETLYSKYR
ncbi:Hemoglobin subunit alpha-B [Aquarana catesbeiana]|uniref:Hemoglobin subunit alpha-B n=2 Tax=Aquarana catesbeiana TaxID=8400 RepID=HBAB_AQUCT|nr:RecName: Full=Hemoglobin subunit alpha-B; AltName: Full=Alpha-B-globin; AltName: Full=Hemoglobin alpha-B chain [Aquarana catesbeiana]AAA64301.1 hemoglobin B alpha chain [Aquarana catesbeiana]PIO29687.1 Hemoglobin subunit alpha-B [Aquarana catesbeiana]